MPGPQLAIKYFFKELHDKYDLLKNVLHNIVKQKLLLMQFTDERPEGQRDRLIYGGTKLVSVRACMSPQSLRFESLRPFHVSSEGTDEPRGFGAPWGPGFLFKNLNHI